LTTTHQLKSCYANIKKQKTIIADLKSL